jgi:membrane associated rhomboid family serine protease
VHHLNNCNDFELIFENYFFYRMKDLSNLSVFRRSVVFTSAFVMVLWGIKAYEYVSGTDLGYLGVYPLTMKGALGIITSPLIHGDHFHLLSNTFPLILLGIGLFYFYHHIAKQVFLWIYLLTGSGVWMIARDAYHIGASGIVYGLLSFLFFIGLFNKDNKSIVISLIVLFLYGGMLGGLIPTDYKISYESHIMGALAGTVVAFGFRKQGLDGPVQIPEDGEDEKPDAGVPHFSPPDHTHSSSQTILDVHYRENKKS